MTSAGVLTAKSGTVGGFEISANRLTGTGSTNLSQVFLSAAQTSPALSVRVRPTTSSSWEAAARIDYSGNVYLRPRGVKSSNFAYLVLDTSAWDTIDDGSGSPAPQNHAGWIYYAPSSSKRYKDILRDMTAEDVEKLYGIQPVYAKFKDGYLEEGDALEGKYVPMFIAEDVEEWFPEAATHNREGLTENWNDKLMLPAMFQMIKSQKETIDAQEEKINKLEERLAALEKKLEDLRV